MTGTDTTIELTTAPPEAPATSVTLTDTAA